MKKILFCAVATGLLLGSAFASYKYMMVETLLVRVADINKGELVSLCIAGEDTSTGCDEYTNSDDIWFFKFDSGTVRSRLAMAETDSNLIKVKVQGVRITWLSIRKNIIKIVE